MKVKTANLKKYMREYRKTHRKECCQYVKDWNERNPERTEVWRNTYKIKHKDRIYPSLSEWLKRNPIKAKAYKEMKKAIKSGKLKRDSCIVCSKTNGQGHHEDYDKPLEVIWLCRKHHLLLHELAKQNKKIPHIKLINRIKDTNFFLLRYL